MKLKMKIIIRIIMIIKLIILIKIMKFVKMKMKLIYHHKLIMIKIWEEKVPIYNIIIMLYQVTNQII